jgi:hypothetical protein
MVNLSEHPALLLCILILSYPVYRGLAVSIFGTQEAFLAAVRSFKESTMRSPLKNPWLEDWQTPLRLFAYAVLCIALVAALYDLSVRYLLTLA